MSRELTLYDSEISGNAYKIRLLLSQLQLPCKVVQLDILHGAAQAPEFTQLNPLGRVPFLIDGDFKLAESNAILIHLARGSSLWREEPRWQALALQWMFFEQNQLELGIGVSRFFLKLRPGHARAAGAIAENRGRGLSALKILEHHLRTNDFAVGEYSVADIALYAYAHLAEEGGFSLEELPAIRRWFERIRSQPRHLRMDQALPSP